MIKIGGVVYRNIQEQVAKNTQDIAKIQRKPVLQVKKVDELPEEGEEGILYLLPATDPEIGNYYEEYLWIDSAWELIGSSSVDISNMVTTDTDQEITGAKTINNELAFSNGTAWLKITNNGWTSTIQQQSGVGLNFGGASLTPNADNSKDFGSSSIRWKDIYLGGKIDFGTKVSGRTNTCKIELDNYDGVGIYSNNVRAINIYDNAIYVAKPFYVTNTIVMRSPNNSDNWKLIGNDNGSMNFGYGVNTYYAMNTACIFPTGNEMRSCGAASLRWSSVYTKEIGNGTDSVSVADMAALITYAKAQGWIS